MRISELLAKKEARDVLCIQNTESLLTMAKVLLKHRIGALLVTDKDDKLVGIASERDIVKALAEQAGGITTCSVGNIMTRSLITCVPGDNVITTLALMNKSKIRHMPVLQDGKPLAMLSIREFDIACRHLQLLSHTDELTGLANRRFFMEALGSEINRRERLKTSISVAMLDLDKFKSINDTHGHDIGDEVLRQLAKILSDRLRNYDIVGRLGGEEFGLMFPNTNLEDAITICENLGDKIRECEVETPSGKIKFTGSFGVMELDGQADDTTKALAQVDKLLYQAKANGRDRVEYKLNKDITPIQPSVLGSTPSAETENLEKFGT